MCQLWVSPVSQAPRSYLLSSRCPAAVPAQAPRPQDWPRTAAAAVRHTRLGIIQPLCSSLEVMRPTTTEVAVMQGSTARLHGDMIAEQPEGTEQRAADHAVPASPMTHRRLAARRRPGGVAQLRGYKQQRSHQSCRHRRIGCAAPPPPLNTPAGLTRRQSAGLPHNQPPLLHRQMQ